VGLAQSIRRIESTRASPQVRETYYRAIAVALVGNGALLVLKGYAARISGSSALFSDAANSASDMAYSLLMASGLWLALRPPDRTHPHGHERVESLVSVAIGVFMALAALEALRNALDALQGRFADPYAGWVVMVPMATALIKLMMYTRVRQLGQSVQSPAILATATDHLTDIYTAAVVLAGVLGARFEVPQADPVAGLLVAVWIFYQAARVGLDGLGQLIGSGGSIETEQAVIDAIAAVPGVLGIDKVIMEHVGPRLRVDIHVYVDGSTPVSEAHHISHAVREAVQALDGVDHAFVHLEPARDQ